MYNSQGWLSVILEWKTLEKMWEIAVVDNVDHSASNKGNELLGLETW